MRKISGLLLISLILCVACQFKLKNNADEEQSSLMSIVRYDRLEYRYLTTGDFSALQEMNTEYPIETRTLIEDVLKIGTATDPEINTKLLKFYQDTTLQMLLVDAETQYSNIDDLNKELNTSFIKLKRWLPDMDIPEVYTQISALDESIVVGNHTIGISLDKYLGKDYHIYNGIYSEAQRNQMTRDMIIPDALSFYLLSLYPLKDFETRQQTDRDLHMGKVQWIVNQAIERKVFNTRFVTAVEQYMRNNPKVSYDELMKMTDFSEFKLR